MCCDRRDRPDQGAEYIASLRKKKKSLSPVKAAAAAAGKSAAGKPGSAAGSSSSSKGASSSAASTGTAITPVKQKKSPKVKVESAPVDSDVATPKASPAASAKGAHLL